MADEAVPDHRLEGLRQRGDPARIDLRDHHHHVAVLGGVSAVPPHDPEHLGRAREVRPDDATAAYYHGQALEKIGDLAGARDALEASLKLTPGQLAARLLLGKVYLGLKNSKAAEDQFEAALLLQDRNVDAQLGLAKALLASGSFKEAVGQLKELTKSHPNNADAYELLARSYKALGNETAAQQAESRAKMLRARGNKL